LIETIAEVGYMLNKSILATAVKYVWAAWFYGELMHTTTMSTKPFGTDLATL